MTTIRIKLSPQLIKMGEEELLIEIDESVLSEEKLQVKKDRYLFLYMEKIIKELESNKQSSTADNYKSTLKSFKRFRKGKNITLGKINDKMMQQYEMYLKNEGIKMNTISFYMRVMRAVYNRAVNDGLATEKQPFRNVYTGIDKTEKKAIPLQTIKAIKELYMPSRALHFARDMFLFSFYTRGMSFIDMAYLKKTDLSNGILTYKRRKTKQQLSIKWEKCMQEIVNKWPSYNDYLLPIITIPGKEERMQYKSCQKNVNMQLDKISKMLKMRKGITMYVARHSWASIAKNMNIPIGVISDSMGHTSLKTTQIYLSAIDMDVINKANLKILNKIEKRNEETKRFSQTVK